MSRGAVHITGSNFAMRRRLRWDILDRMRKLIENGTYKRPKWMDWVEQHPPLETRNFLHTDRIVKNPYIPLIGALLKKYPQLRFEGCYDESNEWQKGWYSMFNHTPGFDLYKHDHPVMQFVTYQLSLMNKGVDRDEAFRRTEQVFYEKRIELEKRQKVEMALGLDEDSSPLYTTGFAYYNVREDFDSKQEKIARSKAKMLEHIRDELRRIKLNALDSKRPKAEADHPTPK